MHGETQTRELTATSDDAREGGDPLAVTLPEAADPSRRSRSLAPLWMVFGTALQYPREIALALIALVITSAATLAIPYRFKVIIDEGFSGAASTDDIAHAFQYLLMIVVILGIGTALRFYFVSWLGERVIADIRLKVQTNLLRLSPGFYEVNSPKEISSRMTSDTAIIENVVGTTVSVALRNLLTGIGGIGFLVYLAPSLTLGLLIGIPVVILPIVYFGRKIRAVSRSSQDRIADVGAYVTEVLSAMKIVQSFGQERRESERFAGVVEGTFATAKRRILLRAAMTSVVILLVFGGVVLVMWRGALAVAAGEISGGTIAAFVLTGGLVAGALGALTEVYGDLLRGAGAASRLAELLEARPEIAPPARPERLQGRGGGFPEKREHPRQPGADLGEGRRVEPVLRDLLSRGRHQADDEAGAFLDPDRRQHGRHRHLAADCVEFISGEQVVGEIAVAAHRPVPCHFAGDAILESIDGIGSRSRVRVARLAEQEGQVFLVLRLDRTALVGRVEVIVAVRHSQPAEADAGNVPIGLLGIDADPGADRAIEAGLGPQLGQRLERGRGIDAFKVGPRRSQTRCLDRGGVEEGAIGMENAALVTGKGSGVLGRKFVHQRLDVSRALFAEQGEGADPAEFGRQRIGVDPRLVGIGVEIVARLDVGGKVGRIEAPLAEAHGRQGGRIGVAALQEAVEAVLVGVGGVVGEGGARK